MKTRLPSLTALKAFLAAGQHGGFTAAARTLFVTPGAVSRQVAALESDLGVALFIREGRKVSLTSAGRAYLEIVEDAFERIAAATATVRDRDAFRRVLTVSTLPSFASRWLAPRLARFASAHPTIDLRLTASRHLVDFEREGVDAAVRYGLGGWDGAVSEFLFAEEIFPVCSPRTAIGPPALTTPSSLAGRTLLLGDIREDWRTWLRAADVAELSVTLGTKFYDDGAMLEAAAEGAGIALGRSVLVEKDLESGRLVAPFDLRVPASYSYWLVVPTGEPAPAVTAFRQWIMAERPVGA